MKNVAPVLVLAFCLALAGLLINADIAPPVQKISGQPSSTEQVAPDASRVVLYDEDSSNPQGKQYVGTVVWCIEPVEGSGNQRDIAVRADIEIPERRLKMTMSFRRNTDSSLPASHTVELTFILPPDFSSAGVADVPGILMKFDEQARGTPLAALAVKVTDEFFLVGLSNVEADRVRNIQLLKEHSWFDIPLVYNNQRRGIVAIEKGVSGERAFDEAFAAWGQSMATPAPIKVKTTKVMGTKESMESTAILPSQMMPVEAKPNMVQVLPKDASAIPDSVSGNLASEQLPDSIGGLMLRSAAVKGNPATAYEVGLRFAEGKGVPVNYSEAAKWLDRAAQAGVVPAAFELGKLYEKGLGVTKDMDIARRYYTQAAERGNAGAMHNLAVFDAGGDGGSPDFKSAAQWFRKAADRGVVDSQFNLGILYARGVGVEQNLVESYKWFSLAAAKADRDAAERRDEVARRLDPKSLAEAKLAIQSFAVEPMPDDAVNVATPPGGWDSVSE